MNIKKLRIFSQNIWKNSSLVNTILRIQSEFDIIFIQELSWITICSISSSKSKDGEELVGIPNHPNWITFSRCNDLKLELRLQLRQRFEKLREVDSNGKA